MRGLTTSLPCDLEPILLGVVGDWRLRLGLKSEQSTTIECTFFKERPLSNSSAVLGPKIE
jgi:hypothetical protein